MTTFIRLLDVPVDAKPAALKAAVAGVGAIFECAPEAFAAVPGSPFAYWLGPRVRELFSNLPKFEGDGRTAKIGASTKNNFRFLRLDWELGPSVPRTKESRWVPFAKGGKRSPYYADIFQLVKWEADAREIEAELLAKFPYLGSNAEFVLHRSHPHFRAGATWTLRAARFSPQFLPAGCVFSDRGYAAFVPDEDLAATIATFNSLIFDYLFKVSLGRHGFPEFIVGTLQSLPWRDFEEDGRRTLSALAIRVWTLMRSLDSVNETSHAFLLPAELSKEAPKVDRSAVEIQLALIQKAIDEAAFRHYGINAEDRARIESADGGHAANVPSEHEIDEDDADSLDNDSSRIGDAEALCSWLVGVVFGRFDLRLATGERPIPPEPEPFDPLPARSPGMVPEGEEPADRPDVLVDDPGYPDDLAARAQAVAERVQVEVPENLRGWLAREFFPLHIRMYSKSRRKAPIYWQLATLLASYSVWLYLHAISKDTLFRVQNDYVAPKLAHEERRLDLLTNELRDGGTAAQRKDLATHERLVEDLRSFLAEVKRVAPLLNPNLDDGVIVNFAPLWRLVPQHKAWQKELKTTWDALREGKYDWAHLAMHLWPERVVAKCARDRSLAIAHGLEDLLWLDDSGWRPRRPVGKERELLIARFKHQGEEPLKDLRRGVAPENVRSTLVAAAYSEAIDSFRQRSPAGNFWEAVDRGDLDDYELARYSAPDRVVRHAMEDFDFAEKHGLAGYFWLVTADTPRRLDDPVQEQQREIRERTSAAVKDALKNLLEAPAPTMGRGGTRRSTTRKSVSLDRAISRSEAAKTATRISAREEPPDAAILEVLRRAIAESNDGASKSDVLSSTGLSDAQWNSVIAALLASGTVSRSGAGRGTRYRLNLNPDP